MPTNSEPRISAIQVSVVAALAHSGRWKAGMPLLMASVPVIAEQPLAKARRMTNRPKALPAAA